MRLTELFDANTAFSLEWDETDSANGSVTADAHDSHGRLINISFQPTGYPVNGHDMYEIIFSRGGSYDITGRADAGRVLGTVVSAIGIYLKKYKPKYIVFSASEDSRISLYSAMIKRVAHGYTVLTPAQYPEGVLDYIESSGSIGQPFILARV